jgi:hypothetical protein
MSNELLYLVPELHTHRCSEFVAGCSAEHTIFSERRIRVVSVALINSNETSPLDGWPIGLLKSDGHKIPVPGFVQTT